MAYTPLVTVMATLVTITTFLEGFGRARLHRSIDHVGDHSQALLTELAKAVAPFARSEAYKDTVRQDFESPFKLPRSAAVIRYGVWVAVPISAALFALLVNGLARSGSGFGGNLANWDPLFTAALVLLTAQVALAVLTFIGSRDNEAELARARAVFVTRLVNEAEKTLHSDAPPDVETARLWADAVAGTKANLPHDRVNDRVRGILQSLEARFHLSAALGLERENNSGPDTAGVTPWSTADQLLQEIIKARELLAALPQEAGTVDSQLAYAVVLDIDFSPGAADPQTVADTLWDAVRAYDVARPPRWLLVYDRLPWEQVIEQHSGETADVLVRWQLTKLAELLLYAGARDPKQRREHCFFAAEAFRAGVSPYDVPDALRAMFEACESPPQARTAWLKLTYDRGFDSGAVLVPLIQTAANQPGVWQKEAADIVLSEAGKLRADPVGWMLVINELRRSKVSEATATTVLARAFPGKSATEAMLAWLSLLDETEPDKAESEAVNLYFAWKRDGADRTAVNQQTVDVVVGLLARSSDDSDSGEVNRLLGQLLEEAAATWTETKTDGN